jgi:hypothetical protein
MCNVRTVSNENERVSTMIRARTSAADLKALKVKAAQEDRPMQDIVGDLIADYVKEKAAA